MRKIFIDGGARVGESIETYLKTKQDLIGCNLHLFECNPTHIDKLNSLQDTYPEYNITVHQAALWNQEGEQDFYYSTDVWGDLGCTLNNSKQEKLDLENPIKVKSIKLSNFLTQFTEDDYIIIKLDIEGAEYEVVEDLLNTGKISLIKEIYIEWHDNFYRHVDFGKLRSQLENYPNLLYNTWNY
jgi:FkbM family methyltransferase